MSKVRHTIAESRFPWERQALEFIRQRLPDRDPFRVWTNFEFIAPDGSINEVDTLVLTPAGFFLVEIKSGPGILRGDAGTWTWENEGRLFTDDNPVLAADRKAKKLKSLLERQKVVKKLKNRLPFIEPLVFCSAQHLQCNLEGTARYVDMQQKVGGSSDPRLVPLPGCILELAPWLKQWHNEIDPEFNMRMGDYFEDSFVEQVDGTVLKESEISVADAVLERQAERDVVVCGDDPDLNNEVAKNIEHAASGSYVRHGKHRPNGLNHYQPPARPPAGHAFYETKYSKARKR